ncbi:MAG TPA: M28 family peptidase [Ignavibacteriaceae bacterium]|nr:M28 family peptidase [Ignavibacteriaceae bacterium]
MKKILTLFCALFIMHQGLAQTNTLVQQIINNVNIDSLTKFVNELSGEVPVIINGQQVTIASRYYNTSTNDKAADYVKAKFESYGLQAFDQNFSLGRNVYAVQEGTTNPDQVFIICAHYDDMPSSGLAPGADDNGSGTCSVIEAARVLKDFTFKYTIIYAIWDTEELGLIGSAYYADNTTEDIQGVINMDMIAYDGNNDNLAEIHTRNIANSVALKDSMLLVNTNYSVGINPSVINPGITASDQASFWNDNYSAILLIENYYGDFNPYYHSGNDLIDHFNMPYYDKCSKLCIGTLALLSKPDGIVPVELASFAGNYDGKNIMLNWKTSTELNNYGFEIEKKTGDNPQWYSIGFVNGNGTIQTPSVYSFTDSRVTGSGTYYYRLKQIDNDGSYKYSSAVEINVNRTAQFVLEQNYPNPFNPSTKISFSIPQSSNVKIAVYNLVGEQVTVLLNGNMEAGNHVINFNASDLPSGVYLCRIQYAGSSRMIKMMLLE